MGTSNVDTIETTRYKMKYKQNPYISKSKNNNSENINNSKEKENENIHESLNENEITTETINSLTDTDRHIITTKIMLSHSSGGITISTAVFLVTKMVISFHRF